MFRYLIALFTLIVVTIPTITAFEPTKEGPGSRAMRGAAQLKHPLAPGIKITSGTVFDGAFTIELANWSFRPDKATNPRDNFADGTQEQNEGHLHGWVFNEAGEQIRFYGATAFLDGTQTDTFEPGRYRLFVQLQNHDHTPTIPPMAPDFPAVDAIEFDVLD